MSASRITLLICCFSLIIAGSVFYPKWKKSGTEATISWDVSGYYMYLPALFIYKDIKQCSFQEEILNKYKPTPDFQQAFRHESGNYVMKYSMGQAIQMLPFFTIAHLYALHSPEYEADGFSRPYQFMIYIGSLIFALLGIFLLRSVLLEYFTDAATSWTMVSIVLGSNYLDYVGINSSMTHNHLFTIYILLIFLTIKFYRAPSFLLAMGIGLCIGMAALTRPTEIISCLIPILWGIPHLDKVSLSKRVVYFKNHFYKAMVSITIVLFIGSWQLFYWKYVTGDWVVYSYEDQGFSWLKPHLIDGIFSYKSGWLTYSPVFIFALIGFYFLFQLRKQVFWACFIFTLVFIYIAFAWDIWWYGGSLGQRAMVQAYPILSFPMAAFFQRVPVTRMKKLLIGSLLALFIYYNLWLTYQAHGGGLLRVGQMTKRYFWKTVLRYEKHEEDLKLLDNKDDYRGKRKEVKILHSEDFEHSDPTCLENMSPITGQKSICVNAKHEFTPLIKIPAQKEMGDYARATATFRCKYKEWSFWTMAQFVIVFYDGDNEIKRNKIRIFRHLNDGETQRIHIDAKFPKDDFTHIGVYLWSAGGNKELMMDDLVLEVYREG